MNRQESLYFVIGIAVAAVLLTVVLNVSSPWVSMASISFLPTLTYTPKVQATPTNTPVPPTVTNTPVSPTATNTPLPPTSTPTPQPPTPTPLPPTLTPTPKPSNKPSYLSVDSAVVTVDEGEWAVNGGTVTYPHGKEVDLVASVGEIVVEDGVWSWTYFAADGPASRQVEIDAVDDKSGKGSGTFDLNVTNVPPELGPISDVPVVAQLGETLQATVVFTDPSAVDLHTAVITWGDGSYCSTSAGLDCSIDEGSGIRGFVAGLHTYTEPGLYTIGLTVTDDDGASDSSRFEVMVAYDPDVDSMTGGGWFDSPEGAYLLDPSATGQGNFSFNVQYGQDARVPKGELSFALGATDLSFQSTSYDWMTITGGSDALLAGQGTIDKSLAPNGEPYQFKLWATDGVDGGGPDTLRIRIWWGAEQVVYDNGTDQAIAQGSIVVHAKNQ